MNSPWRDLDAEQGNVCEAAETDDGDPTDPLSFFRGLLVALPLSGLLWVGIFWLILG